MLGAVTAHSDGDAAGATPAWRAPGGRRVPGPDPAAGSRPPALVAVVASMSQTAAAVRAGADVVDLGPASPDEIRAVQARFAGLGVCAGGPPADVVRDVAAARETGAMAICHGLDAARGSGLPPGQVLVEVPPWLVAQATEEGWAALVDADRGAFLAAARQAPTGWPAAGHREGGDDSGVLAIAAVSSWLDAAAVRTRHARSARRALDMTASIRGLRPPSRAVRGLALPDLRRCAATGSAAGARAWAGLRRPGTLRRPGPAGAPA